MGYAHYVLADGREAGYAVEDVCNDKDCKAEIDRGLGYLCGEMPGGDEWGCGGYFCAGHLFHGVGTVPEGAPTMCAACLNRAVDTHHRQPIWDVLDELGINRARLRFDRVDDMRLAVNADEPDRFDVVVKGLGFTARTWGMGRDGELLEEFPTAVDAVRAAFTPNSVAA